MRRMTFEFESVSLEVELLDTPTAEAIWQALPLEGSALTWGEEVYFATPVSAELETTAREVVDPGTVCFWVQGNSLALPYGRTPASREDECRLVTSVNILGEVEGDPRELEKIRDGDEIQVSAA